MIWIQIDAETFKASGHGVAEKRVHDKKSRLWLIPLAVLETGASDGQNPMRETADVYVCEPEVGINQRLDTVFIQFEVMDRETMDGTGKSHTVLMRVPDAMQLLQTLSHIQERFSLPEEGSDLAMIEIPWKNN